MVAQIDKSYLREVKGRTAARLISYAAFEGRPATTRGQWINPLVRAHLRRASAHQFAASPDRPIFLLGVGRSGTTLLGVLLSAHRDVGFLNEPKMMWNIIDPMEDVSGFYNRSADARVFRNPGDVTSDMTDRARNLYRYYEMATNSQRVVDKYCELSYRRDYLRELFPDCILIAIVRKPAAVIRSIDTWSADHRVGAEDWWGVDDRKWKTMLDDVFPRQPDADLLMQFARDAKTDADRALLEWIVGMRALVDQSSDSPLDLLVHYEDLLKEPEATLSRIFKVAGLKDDTRPYELARAIVRDDARAQAEFDPPTALRPAVTGLLERLGYPV